MKVQHGDILSFHGHSFISLGIQFFMNIWRWIHFDFKPFYKKVPNHIAMGYNDNDIIEARAEGVFISSLDHYLEGKGCTTINVYRYPWSDEQKKEITRYYEQYEGTKYQYVNFFQYIIFILTLGLLWIGRKRESSDNKIYCSELAARIIYYSTRLTLAKSEEDHAAHMFFRNYWKVPPYQLDRWCQDNTSLVTTYEIVDGVVTESSL